MFLYVKESFDCHFTQYTSCTMQEQMLREAEEDNEEKKDDIHGSAKEANAAKDDSNPESDNAKAQKSRKLLSSCTAVEPWLLDQFPLDPRDVVIAHVVHKSTMLPPTFRFGLPLEPRLMERRFHSNLICCVVEPSLFP